VERAHHLDSAGAAIRLLFERFAETGAKHAFQLRSGQEFLGWVLDVGEEAALVSWALSSFYGQATGTDENGPCAPWNVASPRTEYTD
jgi:hypothetical protein